MFLIAMLGGQSAGLVARPLWLWGRHLQTGARLLVILASVLLLAEGVSPRLFDSFFTSFLGGPGGAPNGIQILSH